MAGALRVLHVDDEHDHLDVCRIFLEESGDFSVVTTDSAPAALQLLKKEHFDAIISDYQMPGMDRIRFLVEVRQKFGQVPFILFTGRGREEVVIQAINNGADFYVQKGGDPASQYAELAHKIKKAVGEIRADEVIGASLERLTKSEENLKIHQIELEIQAVELRLIQQELGTGTVNNDFPAGTEVFADPLIVKMFYNLVDNAVRYGGKITTIRFFVEGSGDYPVIICEDDGDGIPADEKEKIFELGFGRNTGFGLALSREILSITGIAIRETGEPGNGARFEMTVPEGTWRTGRKET